MVDAQAIYKRFLTDHSEEQVNLPGLALKKCKKTFAGAVRLLTPSAVVTITYPLVSSVLLPIFMSQLIQEEQSGALNQWVFDEAFESCFKLMARSGDPPPTLIGSLIGFNLPFGDRRSIQLVLFSL